MQHHAIKLAAEIKEAATATMNEKLSQENQILGVVNCKYLVPYTAKYLALLIVNT